ncbi:MAG: epoxyqueuosine reductase [Actinobacteria bacterium]|nr:epoxyqueuosine reductase [Actinomycetota bacterium]
MTDLQRSPSHRIAGLMPPYTGTGTVEDPDDRGRVVRWPEGAMSAVVLAVAHPSDQPDLDRWYGRESSGDTPGNRLLIAAVDRLADWLEAEHGVHCRRIPYHVERGAVYMKDAAVVAGLGCIGRNNLLLTPEYGPRQRLRVLLADADLPSSGPRDYDPCDGCPEPCRAACPRQAFPGAVYSPEDFGIADLPGRDGSFDRVLCDHQMSVDVEASEQVVVEGQDDPVLRTDFCRACELACIAGVDRLG